jgi:hypothetical protein
MTTGKFWMISADPEQSPAKTIEYIIKRSYYKFGIFLDYDCPEGQECILQVSSYATEALKAEISLCSSHRTVISLAKRTQRQLKTVKHNEDTQNAT